MGSEPARTRLRQEQTLEPGGLGSRVDEPSRGPAEQPDAADEVHAASGNPASQWPSQLIRVLGGPENAMQYGGDTEVITGMGWALVRPQRAV